MSAASSTSFADATSDAAIEPAIFTIDYHKGRVFHTVLGHSDGSMKGLAFHETLKRGAEWAATGDVTFPPVDAKTLTADKAAMAE